MNTTKQNTFTIVLVAIAFTFGLVVQPYFSQSTIKSDDTAQWQDDHNKLNQVKLSFQKILDSDIKEYQELKTMKAKYETANDILGKIMTIFLAELSLRMTDSDIQHVKNETFDSSNDLESGSSKNCKPAKESQCLSLNELVEKSGQMLVAKGTTIPEDNEKWKEKKIKVKDLNSESEVDDFLTSVEIPDFFKEATQASALSPSELQRVIGRFEGTLTFDAGQDKLPADVLIDIDGEIVDGELKGDQKIALSRNGDAFSSSSGDGKISNFKKPANTKDILFLDLGGKMGYFQLYFLSNDNAMLGNFYQQVSLGKFKKSGQVKVFRK